MSACPRGLRRHLPQPERPVAARRRQRDNLLVLSLARVPTQPSNCGRVSIKPSADSPGDTAEQEQPEEGLDTAGLPRHHDNEPPVRRVLDVVHQAVAPLQRVDALPGFLHIPCQVPHLSCGVVRGGAEGPAAVRWVEDALVDSPRVALEPMQEEPRLRVPHARLPVLRGGGKHRTVRVKTHVRECGSVPFHALQKGAALGRCVQLPDLGRAVRRGAQEDAASVGAPRDAADRAAVTPQNMEALASPQAPDSRRAVGAAGGNDELPFQRRPDRVLQQRA
mmetsp:Transcript_7670/g.18839  ORF Transcript_7670/g.18839 Transcript_7670/m.18839 type:complete len:278 (-) Transcript_7670:661-1494(-)